jgi:aspartate dehydrogenase
MRIRAVFIGWGAINMRVGALLAQRNAAMEIVGIATLDTPEGRGAIPPGIRFLASPRELAALQPDIVVEAAGRAAINMWAEVALAAAPAMIVASTSAFGDEALLARLVDIADQHGSRIFIPSGAIGAVDALASATVLGLDEVTHQIVKPPRFGRSAPPSDPLLDLEGLNERAIFFSGNAREAASRVSCRDRYRPWPKWWPTPRFASTAIASRRAALSAAWKFCLKTIRWRLTRNHPNSPRLVWCG